MIQALQKNSKYPQKKPVVLAILDGVGLAPPSDKNAVQLANTPTLDRLFQGDLFRHLKAHGTAVGMPTDDDMGNSEVGHNALGAGRVFAQGASLVNQAVESKAMFQTELWRQLVGRVITNQSTFHIVSLLSDGNVHSHKDHLKAMLDELSRDHVQKVRLHILLDGRDVPARSALGYVEECEEWLQQINQSSQRDYKIASGGGRMLVTMDRYGAEWDMVERGWHTHVLGKGQRFASAKNAILDAYQDPDLIDQYIPPFVIEDGDQPMGAMADGDSVVLANFRGDRAIEISQAFDNDEFIHFDRIKRPDVLYAGMMQYDGDLNIPTNYLVSPPQIDGSVAEYMCASGIKTLAISETQKYGHVTFFWNGNKSEKISESLEEYIEIPSDAIPFNQAPAMKAKEITDVVCDKMRDFDFIRINYPNGDMVGHTGDLQAVIESMEAVDESIQRLEEAVKHAGGILVVLADHGNADDMTKTAHTLNPVPFVIVDDTANYKLAELDMPGLANVAATLCNLLGFESPKGYDQSLIQF
ncbi:MAG: 2,3-bisphosphoglycerate-independent phosphoglycerate mutase [Candidatus Margulisiibacteriota bacterium]|nr:2,3-bisphosphoglycerate-independent phosphoglycerate mutase [Candidatus Margulisiibacteriota bacterium]